MAYLKPRRGKDRSGYRWYVRINVPSDVREVLGKQTIARCLHTSNFKEAQQRRHAVLAAIFESFERVRRHRISSADIEHEAQRHLREQLELIRKQPDALGFGMYKDATARCGGLGPPPLMGS